MTQYLLSGNVRHVLHLSRVTYCLPQKWSAWDSLLMLGLSRGGRNTPETPAALGRPGTGPSSCPRLAFCIVGGGQGMRKRRRKNILREDKLA